MNMPIGTIVNVVAVIAGGSVGTLLGTKIPERVQKSAFMAIGLCAFILGLQLALKGDFLLLAGCTISGTLIGGILDIAKQIERFGNFLKTRVRSKNPSFINGFVTASLIFCVGSNATLGPIQDAFYGDRTLLYINSILDLFTSAMLAATFGMGVTMAFISVLLYQLFFFLLAPVLSPILADHVMIQLMGVGGIMIAAIGIVVMEIKSLPIANMLPAMIIVVAVANLMD